MKTLLFIAALSLLPLAASAAPVDFFDAPDRALLDALVSVVSRPWDGGRGLEALLAGLRDELRRCAMITIRAVAADGSQHDVRARVYTRKWLAVKGYK